MDINKLIKEYHQIMIDKGFYDCPECKDQIERIKNLADDTRQINRFYWCKHCDRTRIDPNKNIGELLMLIVSELGEALEAHRNKRFCDQEEFDRYLRLYKELKEEDCDKPVFEVKIKDTFEDKIADVFLSLFDLCGYLKIEPSPNIPDSFKYELNNIGEILLYLSNNIFNIKQNGDREYYISISLYYLWCAAVNNFNIDIEKHILAKMEYNKSRPYKYNKEY